MTTTVIDYQHAAADLPDEMFLGQLVFFTISEADVNLDTMRTAVGTHQLRDDTLRKRLRPIDAFKKATNEIAVKFAKTAGRQDSILVRSVGQDSQTSHRHVVLERAQYATGQRRRLLYDTIASIVYDRGTRQKDGSIVDDFITVTVNQSLPHLTDEEKAWVEAHVGTDGAQLIARYTHWREHLDSHAIRAFVRDYLLLLGGIQAKANGGVYFVPQRHVDELRRLATLIGEIGSDMHLVPLLDIVDQRQMLARAFEQETMTEVDSLMVELAKILHHPSRTITPATYDDYVQTAAELLAKADDYTALLGDNLDTARLRIDTFKTQVLTLAARIKVPKKMRTP
jgi:hypothetical protein